MNLIPQWGWLQQMTGRTEGAEGAVTGDAADMGTAFGLDASFGNVPDNPSDRPPGNSATHSVSPLTGLPRN